MSTGPRMEVLGRLREHIATIENGPRLKGGGGAARARERAGMAAAPWRALPGGLVHEVWTADGRDAGAGLGFALGQARGLVSGDRPVIVWLQPGHEAAETGLVYGAGLRFFGIGPDKVVIGRLKGAAELLWTAEEALGCRGVAAVVADIAGYPKPLDFTASRRLALRAAKTGASAFLVRYGPEKPASAAFMRWQVSAAPSGPVRFDPRAPGAARFFVTLERAGTGMRGNWLLEWQDDGFDEIGGDSGADARPAAPGAVVPVLGHRLSQAG